MWFKLVLNVHFKFYSWIVILLCKCAFVLFVGQVCSWYGCFYHFLSSLSCQLYVSCRFSSKKFVLGTCLVHGSQSLTPCCVRFCDPMHRWEHNFLELEMNHVLPLKDLWICISSYSQICTKSLLVDWAEQNNTMSSPPKLTPWLKPPSSAYWIEFHLFLSKSSPFQQLWDCSCVCLCVAYGAMLLQLNNGV